MAGALRPLASVLPVVEAGRRQAEEERAVCLERLQMWKVDRIVYSSSETSSLSPYSSSNSSSSQSLYPSRLPKSSVYPNFAAALCRASASHGQPFSRAQRSTSTRPFSTAK